MIVFKKNKMRENLKNTFFKIWYWYLSTIDKNAEIIFMNYGYSKNSQRIKLDETDEKNRYSIQLYNHIVEDANINGKDILEVSCGRGGGLSYINKYLSPNSVTGVDLSSKAIKLCQSHYPEHNNTFLQANAQNLPFSDKTFDVVINVESSHRYARPELFFKEVNRVLKADGVFLFTDFRQGGELQMLRSQIRDAKFKFIKKEDITDNIVEALKLSTYNKKVLINKLLPDLFQSLGRNFAATEKSPTYNRFAERYFEYVYYVLKKQ